MDFDFTTETITPDVSTILTIGGTGALELPSGTTAQEPGTAVAGALRWNTTQTWVEYYNGTIWQPFTSPSSAVTSFSAGTTGFTPNTATTGAITLAGTLGATSGGTGSGTAPSAGQFLYSSAGTTYAPTTLSSVAIVSVSGTAGNITASTTAGAVTINLATAGTAGTYGQVTTDSFGRVTSGVTINTVPYGGTGAATFTTDGVLFGNGTSAIGATAAGTTGQVLVGNTGAAPSFSTLSSIAVTSFSAGTTGLTPATATTGAITLAGTLNLASGGTNASLTATNGGVVYSTASAMAISAAGTTNQLLQSNGAAAPTWTSAPTISGANFTATTIPNSALVNSSITIGTTSISLGGTSTTLAGVTSLSLTGANSNVTGVGTPVNASDAVPLSYLQSVVAGLEWKQEAVAATTADLGTVTYSNGSSGVGATLTNAGTQAAFTIDGVTPAVGQRVLIKNETNQTYNGIYTVTTVGSSSVNWVLTRTTDANGSGTPNNLDNATLLITQGTTNANTGWTQTTANPTVGTSNIVFAQFSGSGTYAAGTGLTLTGNIFSLTSPVSTTLGGTGTTTAPTSGQLLVGTSTGTYTPFTVTSGTGISTTTGSGTFQINNTGVTSAVAGTGITVSSATGAVTITNAGVTSFSAGTTGFTPTTATTGAVTLAGVLNPANGGTGVANANTSTITLGGSFTTTPANNVTLTTTRATNVTLPTSGTLATTGNTVASFQTSLTGLTPTTATTGAVTLAGTLGVASGGTGATTFTLDGILYGNGTGAVQATSALTNGQLLIGSTGSAPVAASLTAGTNIYLTTGAGSLTVAGPKYWAESSTAPVVLPSATGNQSVAIGDAALSTKYGQLSHASGDFSAAGDAQSGEYILRNTTTNATPTALFLDGASATLTVPTGSIYSFTANIVCVSTTGTTTGAWQIQGLITNFAGTAAIQGFTSTTFIAGTTGLVKGSVTATASGGALVFTVTGIAATTIRWVCTCKTTEVIV